MTKTKGCKGCKFDNEFGWLEICASCDRKPRRDMFQEAEGKKHN